MKAVQGQPSFKILICMIRIWDSQDTNDLMSIPDECDMLTEIKSVEISESYSEVVDTAVLRLPKGSVIRKTVHSINAEEETGKLRVSVDDAGVVEEIRSEARRAKVTDFSVGRRIKIQLGYTTDPKVAAMAKVMEGKKSVYTDREMRSEYEKAMNYTFDGYITKCGMEEPIEVRCEDLGHMLKKVMCPRIGATTGLTVNDFLEKGGKYDLLDGTGLTLYPNTAQAKMKMGKFSPDKNMTVYELLVSWRRKKLHPFVVVDGSTPYLAVGKAYFSNAKNDSVVKILEGMREVVDVDFGYHVANNGLTLSRVDPLCLAVRAKGTNSAGKELHLVVMLNPEYGSNAASEKYRVVNETELSKKGKKAGKGVAKVDLKKYTVVDYRSEDQVTKDSLKKESIEYFEDYNLNGMDGTLTLFGDLAINTGQKIHLKDDRQSVKNGVYVTGEVVTKFGTDGYRQTVKLPYCIALDSENE